MEKDITLTLSDSQVMTIINALNEIPFKYAAPILTEIKKQLQEKKAE